MRTHHSLLAVLLILVLVAPALAISATDTVASPGKPVDEETAVKQWVWPKGVLELVNDHRRTVGWNRWFSELPNDVVQFAFVVKEPADLKAIIEQFTAIKAEGKRVELAAASEGKAGIKIDPPAPVAVIFSLGSQAVMNRWYELLEEEFDADGRKVKVFGKSTYKTVPTAMPPTLTIYVQHPHVDLGKLDLPVNVSLSAEIWAAKAAKEGKDDKTIKSIVAAVAEHEAKQKKAEEEKKK